MVRKRPFAGPEQVLAYLSRYTHQVAISNSRLIAADATGVTFRYEDYRIMGPGRYCQRRSKNASAGRSENTSVMPVRRPRKLGSFVRASGLDRIIYRRIRARTV